MLSESAQPARPSQWILSLIGLLVSFGLVIVTLIALILPWVWEPTPGGERLAHYAPAEDGDSLLYAVDLAPSAADLSTAWQPAAWESYNFRVLPVGQALVNVLDQDLSEALADFYSAEGRTPGDLNALMALTSGSQVYQQRNQLVDRSGQITATVSLLVRNDGGEYMIGLQDLASAQTLLFMPPPLLLPADLTPGRAWQTEGELGQGHYQFQGSVLEAGAYTGPLGRYEDCLHVEQRLILLREGATLSDQVDRSWHCAGIGAVALESRDAAGALVRRSLLVAASHLPDAIRQQVSDHPHLLPPMTALPAAPAAEMQSDGWQLSRVGRTLLAGQVGETTIPPVWAPGEPPLILGAGYLGDLVAFDATSADGDLLWRYHPGGTVYSPPAVDPTTGVLYFGASDRRLYALNRQGLFLWSRAVGDNIATRPLVVDGVVIVGSEDRAIYGVDARSGALRWQHSVGGPVVSSPALAAGLAIIGSDDGAIYALDPQTGAERWLYLADDPIEAPIVAAGDEIYVASRGNRLFALNAVDGSERWSVDTRYTLQTAPAVDTDTVYVVDAFGDLSAYARVDGRRRWTLPHQRAVGPPLATADGLFVADIDGNVRWLDQDGQPRASWRLDETSGEDNPGYLFGPVLGGDALWLADGNAVIQRLGPPLLAAAPPVLTRTRTWLDPVFNKRPFLTTPLIHNGDLYLLDSGNRLYRSDPAGERIERVAQVGDGVATLTEPVIGGDLLIVPTAAQLIALALPGGEERWRFDGHGVGLNPPIVAGDLVLWLTLDATGSASVLSAVDLVTGARRWQIDGAAIPILGGLTADDASVYLSTPPAAVDLASGALRWQRPPEQMGIGRPLLSADGSTLFVGLIHEDGNSGLLAALDPADGDVRWESTLPGLLGPLEQMWQWQNLLIAPLYLDTGDIVALDVQTGDLRWRYRPPVSRLGTVTLIGDRLWVPLQDGRTILLDAASGEKLVTLGDVGANLNSYSYAQRPIAVDDRVLVPMVDQLRFYREP